MKVYTNLFKATVMLIAFIGSQMAYADTDRNNGVVEPCSYPALATNLAFPGKFGSENTDICVDVPVNLTTVKMFFNLDTATFDGKGNAVGLKHMVMLGSVIKDGIAKGTINPENVSVIGILHGSALPWVIKHAAPTAESTPQQVAAYKSWKQQQVAWISTISKLKAAGVNLQIEACGAAMNGAGYTNSDLITSAVDAAGNNIPVTIHVNQGAIGREVYLQQKGYAYINESYQDHD